MVDLDAVSFSVSKLLLAAYHCPSFLRCSDTAITILDFISRCPHDSITSCWGNSIRIAVRASLGLKVISPLGLERCSQGVWVTAVAELCRASGSFPCSHPAPHRRPPSVPWSPLTFLERRRPYSHSTSPLVFTAAQVGWLRGAPPAERTEPGWDADASQGMRCGFRGHAPRLHRACARVAPREARGKTYAPIGSTSFRCPRLRTSCCGPWPGLGSVGSSFELKRVLLWTEASLTLEPARSPP